MKTSKQTETRTQIKRRAILDAAKQIFLKQGFRLSSMDDIAKMANVSKRTVYDHFGSKEELFRIVLGHHWDNLFTINHPLFDENKSIADNLTDFANMFFTFLYQPDTIAFFRLLIAEVNQFPDLLSKLVINEQAPFTMALTEYLKDAHKRGIIKIPSAERAAAYFMGLLKEYHFWPMMLGFTKENTFSNQDVIITEAIEIFIKSYRLC